jgi:hypothetical protein
VPKVIQIVEGDGVTDDAYALTIALPDTNGGNALIGGTMQAKGLALVTVSAADTLPSAPASGLLYFNLQIDPITGGVAVQQSTTAEPPPYLASDGVNVCRLIYADVLAPTSTNPSYSAGGVIPVPGATSAPIAPPTVTGATDMTFTQSTPAYVWTITHALGRNPSVTTYDTNGAEMYGDVAFPSVGTVIITFSPAVAGTAYLV